MGYIYHEPGKRSCSVEPRITVSQQFIALNKACVDTYFKDLDHVKIGYDKDAKRMIFIPVKAGTDRAMKLIRNEKSTSKYINAARAFKNFSLVGADSKVLPDYRGEYRCSYDQNNKGITIDLVKGKID